LGEVLIAATKPSCIKHRSVHPSGVAPEVSQNITAITIAIYIKKKSRTLLCGFKVERYTTCCKQEVAMRTGASYS
jgi:hypothetical protein